MTRSETYEFEKKFLDKGIFTWHFNLRYQLLKMLGLNGYSLFAFLLGVAITLGVLELLG